MLLILLLDPHWEVVGDAIYFLFMLGIGVALVGWLLLRVEARAESKRTDTKSRAWSTQRATIVVVSVVLLMLLINLFR
jgi:hypothetical protein